ncbi:MAG TPA: cytochrome c3 family protein [Vicinamibacterales bacterium]|nr:cytochrome c3 family protein [Vicinamibacterales bacterium]
MRIRTAKKLAQRIDLNYFKRRQGLGRWRLILSLAVPLLGLLWLGGLAAAGNRAPYSSGPVASAHAFIENKCEVCHQRDTSFRAHVADKACLTCHSAPGHPPSRPLAASAGRVAHPTEQPDCATCHREHQGRGGLAAAVPDRFCVDCHADLTPGATPAPPPARDEIPAPPGRPAPATSGPWPTVRSVRAFPSGHPEFAVLREPFRDPGHLRFNHQVHLREDLRGPDGAETLECTTCHKPQLVRTAGAEKRVTNLMTSVTYDQQCARCHPLFFDERIDRPAPHVAIREVRPFVQQALREYIAANPQAIWEREGAARRLPLNFPRDPEPVVRTADEWVRLRANRADRLLVERTCAYCHGTSYHVDGTDDSSPKFAPTNLRKEWMSRARFDHAPHLMVQCGSCHAAADSRDTADVLMPSVATCAACHAPGKGAPSQCADCHGYHDWTQATPVKPHFKLTDFR